MSRENVEIVREMADRFAAGDRSSWRSVIAEDVIWDTGATAMPAAGIYTGHDGVERFFVEWLGAWENPEVETLELIDAGDSVIQTFRWTGRGKTSGVEVAGTFFGIHDIHAGKIVRFHAYPSRAEALAAAGLSE